MTSKTRESQLFPEIIALFADSIPSPQEIVDVALQNVAEPEVQEFFLEEAFAERLRKILLVGSSTDSLEEFVAVRRLLKDSWNVDETFKTTALQTIKRKLIETEWLHFKSSDALEQLVAMFPEEETYINELSQTNLALSNVSLRVGAGLAIGTIPETQASRLSLIHISEPTRPY